MKKTYIKPTIETAYIAIEQMIAASGGGHGITFDDDHTNYYDGYGGLNNDYADGDAMSKSRGAFGTFDF